jgi:hypothetical protein
LTDIILQDGIEAFHGITQNASIEFLFRLTINQRKTQHSDTDFASIFQPWQVGES